MASYAVSGTSPTRAYGSEGAWCKGEELAADLRELALRVRLDRYPGPHSSARHTGYLDIGALDHKTEAW